MVLICLKTSLYYNQYKKIFVLFKNDTFFVWKYMNDLSVLHKTIWDTIVLNNAIKVFRQDQL